MQEATHCAEMFPQVHISNKPKLEHLILMMKKMRYVTAFAFLYHQSNKLFKCYEIHAATFDSVILAYSTAVTSNHNATEPKCLVHVFVGMLVVYFVSLNSKIKRM